MTTLVLASASPRRRELLERLGYALQVVPSDLDESVRAGEAPPDYVLRLATEKAAACQVLGWVVAADTTVALGDDIFGKPASPHEAAHMLQALSGRSHLVHTGFAVQKPDRSLYAEVVTTQVVFAPLTDDDIDKYVASREWEGKAGGYAVQGLAAAYVLAIHGSITNVIGLPLAEVRQALVTLGAPQPSRLGPAH